MQLPIPYHMEKRGDDYVSYTAIDADGTKTDKDNICYAHHMSMLSTHAFDLVPYRTHKDWKKWAIDGPSYLRFIDLFKENWLVHETVRAEVDAEGTLKMHIPRGMSRHRVYSAMCAYRWAESMPAFVYLTMKLYDNRKDLSFWQILHYVMSTQVTGTGHNWCHIGITNVRQGYLHMCNGMAWNLGYGLVLPLFWYKTEEELLKDNQPTCNAIDALQGKVAPCKGKDGQKYGYTVPTLLVCGAFDGWPMPNDILNPIWTPLYKHTSSAAVGKWDAETLRTELLAMYQDIIKDYEPAKTLRDKFENGKKDKYGSFIWD